MHIWQKTQHFVQPYNFKADKHLYSFAVGRWSFFTIFESLHSGNWGGSFDFGFLLFFDLIKCILKENEQKSTFIWVLLGKNTLYSELSGIEISANRNFAAFYVVILSNFAAL